MKLHWTLALLLLGCPGLCQSLRPINGFVTDAQTGERLPGATVRIGKAGHGTTTNQQGYFALTAIKTDTIYTSYMGYSATLFLADTVSKSVLVRVWPVSQQLETVTVTEQRVRDNLIGMTTIPIRQLRQVPMPLGENDVMKALAFTPGVSVGNEGTSGLLVRGGSPDQNLILLDEVPLYNQSHLFGLVSTFNPDAIKNVILYKGAFPARFGGRLSSVIDVTMRDGNTQAHKQEISIGLISSRLLLEGPLGKTRLLQPTYMVSARSSYLTLFLLPTIISFKRGNANGYFNYWLYDINAKVTFPLSSTKRLSVSLFRGHDYWYGWDGGKTEQSRFQLDWGNTTATVRYHQAVRANLFFTGLAGYSRYQYRSGYTNYAYDEDKLNQTNQFILGSSVRDWIARGGLEWHVRPAWQVRVGIETIVHQYIPSVLKTTFTVGQTILATTNQPINTIEQAVYGEQEWRPSSNLTIQPGLRLVGYRAGTKIYPSVEPRLGVNWSVWDKLTLKAGYSKMRQFVHLLNSNAVGLPNDIWVPATANVAPQRASQLTAGLATSLGKRQAIQVSIEGYYKWLNDLTDVATGASLLGTFDESWEQTIEKHGQGRARGVEVMFHKPTGRLNGWMAYTYAKNERQFATINEGRWFRSNFDRRHVGNLVVNYQLRPRVSVSSAWQYQSGQPTTVPVALVRDHANSYYPNYVYGDRNNFQMPSYHRLDLSLAFDRTTRRHHTRTWTLGVINAYNRRNPLFLRLQNRSVFTEPHQFLDKPIGYRSTLLQQSFFPVLPYLSYSLKL